MRRLRLPFNPCPACSRLSEDTPPLPARLGLDPVHRGRNQPRCKEVRPGNLRACLGKKAGKSRNGIGSARFNPLKLNGLVETRTRDLPLRSLPLHAPRCSRLLTLIELAAFSVREAIICHPLAQ